MKFETFDRSDEGEKIGLGGGPNTQIHKVPDRPNKSVFFQTVCLQSEPEGGAMYVYLLLAPTGALYVMMP